MTMNLKRLWDTENKKIVWAIPTGDPHKKLQVWSNDDGSKLYVYDIAGYREINQSTVDAKEYGPVWKQLDDETVGYYLTNVPTDLYNWDSGDEVAYRFMNGTTVLQSGTVDEGETPEYTGETPTKSATAQYTYTFSGWKPAVGPISKKTDYKAQFTSTVNKYTVSIASEDIEEGVVDESSVTDVPYGTKLSTDGNVLTIGEGTSAVEVTATAEIGYVFSSWGEVPATVTENINIVASFLEESTPGEDYLEWQTESSEITMTATSSESGFDSDVVDYVSNLGTELQYTISSNIEGFDDSNAEVNFDYTGAETDYPYEFSFTYTGTLTIEDGDTLCTISITNGEDVLATATIEYLAE